MIRSTILVVFFIHVAQSLDLTYISPPTGRSSENSLKSVDAFLVKFGLHPLAAGETLASITDSDRTDAIVKFQQRNRITPADGNLNEQTISKMVKPRCGTPDMADINNNMNHTRQTARFSLAEGNLKWQSPQELTYFIENFTPDLPQDTIIQAITDAWSYWESVANIKTRRVMSREGAKLIISFNKGDHGDGPYTAFDGPNGVLAHAYFPEDGRIHFDDDETFTEGQENIDWGTYNLRIVAAHEFGHTLGLDHSNDDENALMAPFYQGFAPRERCILTQDDIDGVRALYGIGGTGDANTCGPSSTPSEPQVEPTTTAKPVVTTKKAMPKTEKPRPQPTTTQPPRRIPKFRIPSSAADPCNMAIDAIWLGSDEHFWAIRGPWLYRAKQDGEIVEVKRTSEKFEKFPLRPDAATFKNGKLYIFKDVRVWEYSETGAFLRIQRATSAKYPGKMRAKSKAAYLDSDGTIKIIFGSDIYLFDEENINNTRKVSTTNSFGLNNQMFDAATSDRDNIYLFRGRNYRKISKNTMRVLDGYNTGGGKNIGIAFFGCSGKFVPK